MLRCLLRDPGLTVSAVADRTGSPIVLASQYLRALNARGLIAADRQGKYVRYRPAADASVASAGPLLSALRRMFAKEANPVDLVFHLTTAFTHPRRVAIAQALAGRPMTTAALVRATRISNAAMKRHLAKLVQRGFVMNAGGKWDLTCPRHALAITLLGLAAGRECAAHTLQSVSRPKH